jgi:putative FmdB family regulatory protein
MPIYEYRCKKCEHRFELMRRLSERTKRAKCTNCGSTATKPAISMFAHVSGSSPDAYAGDGEAEDFMGGMGGMEGMPDMGGMDDFGGGMGDDFDF